MLLFSQPLPQPIVLQYVKKNINFTNALSFNFHQVNFQRQKKKHHSENLASTQVHWDQSSNFLFPYWFGKMREDFISY